MKTIEERAQKYAHKYRRDTHDLKGERADAVFAAYCQGAQDVYKELSRWHDPKEPPVDDKEVLCKLNHPFNTYEVMHHDQYGWWQRTNLQDGCWCARYDEIIGWREIHENE